eukprot:CAMPEP_0204337188 /NCGR_PEP_ID=MMETSP0469-20131031/20124_1 /ASSEMBLY_ACC=CAM_ASM_000384 /TAXON_ID=2969 /ORGANISM="Oxyrrhis marina" /LENGTH=61 /DNA_ID=CAMNT_0051321181 /DNA_START=48 /DNA_END=230 /DNA_ORIENTATION=-
MNCAAPGQLQLPQAPHRTGADTRPCAQPRACPSGRRPGPPGRYQTRATSGHPQGTGPAIAP